MRRPVLFPGTDEESALYEGRRVVCVDVTGWPRQIVMGDNPPILPEEGGIYTIRSIIPGREYGWL